MMVSLVTQIILLHFFLCFLPGFGSGTVLKNNLINDLSWKMDKRNLTLLLLMDFVVSFSNIHLVCLPKIGLGVCVL